MHRFIEKSGEISPVKNNDLQNKKKVTVKAVALEVIEKNDYPEHYLDLIPAELQKEVLGETRNVRDVDDDFDLVIWEVKKQDHGSGKTQFLQDVSSKVLYSKVD